MRSTHYRCRSKLLLIAIVNIESLCSMKICESICRETFHAVYYFLLFLAWVKKFSLFSISQCWEVCSNKSLCIGYLTTWADSSIDNYKPPTHPQVHNVHSRPSMALMFLEPVG